MFRKSVFSACLFVAGGSALGGSFVGESKAAAQESVLDEIYGRGVHRYFAHDYQAAMQNLTLAIENGSKDPRAHYFRGLAAAAMGNFAEADMNWQAGAALEVEGAYGNIIGKSLARVQGPARLQIERARQTARLQALANKNAKDGVRFGTGGGGLSPRLNMPAVLPEVTDPSSMDPSFDAAVPPTAVDDPFADDPMAGDGEATVDSTDSLSGALDAARPDAVEPAGATPATPDAGSTPPADDGGFPFGGGTDAPAGDDPFGGF